MSTPVVIRGTLRPDGQLELAEKVALPPGPVQVTVQPVKMTVLEFVRQMEIEREGTGYVPRTREEIDADLNAMRDEWEEHQLALE